MARLLLAILVALFPASAYAAGCTRGAYGPTARSSVAIGADATPPAVGQRYIFLDGRRGFTGDHESPVSCSDGNVMVEGALWPKIALTETMTEFDSDGTKLSGKLIEPAGPGKHPLVVMVHGSEKTSAVAFNSYAYVLAGQGIAVFVYDKRGTGSSEGEYTQNFELLGDDAAAALRQAQRLAAGRYTRSGFYGGSQGGWVAPLAANHGGADFVAIGFGLVVSPIEEDREQLVLEARAAKLDPAQLADINALSRATAAIVSSHFATGYEALERLRRRIGGQPWAKTIQGEYSGDMLRMSDADLRRVGQPLFDNLELIWDYDATLALKRLKVPLLWVLAGDDREAPIEKTQAALSSLVTAGKPIDLYLFPHTDHGMFEYQTLPDGSRKMTRITEGFYRLVGDWIKGEAKGAYGEARRAH